MNATTYWAPRGLERIICVHRNSAIVLPVVSLFTSASHTWVVRPPWTKKRLASNSAFERGADEVGFELGRREPGSAVRERHDASVTACGIGERDDGGGVKITVRRQMLLADLEPAASKAMPDLDPIQT